jgi:hypothetical protein
LGKYRTKLLGAQNSRTMRKEGNAIYTTKMDTKFGRTRPKSG